MALQHASPAPLFQDRTAKGICTMVDISLTCLIHTFHLMSMRLQRGHLVRLREAPLDAVHARNQPLLFHTPRGYGSVERAQEPDG
jgi:hypothetical protein